MLRRIPPRTRRIIGVVLAGIMFLVLVGVTYQGVATSLERRDFTRPGGLGDVGGLQLHIYCTGSGAPTVVLDAAAGSLSAAWGPVQTQVSRTTRVCSYDRAGLGWSESRDSGYDPARVPDDLRALLKEAREPGPFVLVGHELGAAFARLFAERYPGDTAALVLIDDPTAGSQPAEGRTMLTAWPWLARVGVLRLSGYLSRRADGLPGRAGGAMKVFLNRPDHLTNAAMEIARMDEVRTAATASTLDPAIGVVSLATASDGPPKMIVTEEDRRRITDTITTMVTRLREVPTD